MAEDISGGNLFMMCPRLEASALTELSPGYKFRLCTPEELDVWKAIHFDSESLAREYQPYMTAYFEQVYGSRQDEFYSKCLFLCDSRNMPIGTCFAWKAYDSVMTIQWYKIRREYEGRGLGRALLSQVMKNIAPEDYPVYLHTHPGCLRAIKLYSDFGFSLLTNAEVGYRINDLEAALAYLKQMLLPQTYHALTFTSAPESFLEAAKKTQYSQF